MLGPVFTADLRSHSRRPRLILLRIAFVTLLLCLFVLCYGGMPTRFTRQSSTVLADFASKFVFFYMIGQFAFLLLIGPTYVASAIAEERQRGTLDYLFSSNLTNYEIIIGKYFSRLALLGQFVLIGLPVLVLVQLIGGVSLEMMAGMLMGTLGCLASLTALTLLLSVISRQGRDALVRTFLVVIALLVVWFLLYQLQRSASLYSWFPSSTARSLSSILDLLLLMNPVYVSLLLWETLSLKGNIDGLSFRWFSLCLAQHLAVAAMLVLLCIWIIRSRFLKQADSTVKRDKHIRAYQKPAVWSNFPIYWKERYVQGSSWRLFAWVTWIRKILLPSPSLRLSGVFISAALLIYLIAMYLEYPTLGASNYIWMSSVFWLVYGLLACSMLAAILRTASGIAVEKDRETWDALVASPVSIQDMMLSRLYGGFLSARWLFFCSMMLLFFISFTHANHRDTTNYHHLINSIIFAIANLGYLVFTLGLAAYFSLSSNSSIRNVMSALTVLVMLNLLPMTAQTFFSRNNSGTGLVTLIFFLTEPASYLVVLAIGGIAIAGLLIYYKLPKLRWLYGLIKWMGNMLALNAVLLLIVSGFAFAFGGYLPLERIMLFVAPLMFDFTVMGEFLIPLYPDYFNRYRDGGAMLFLFSSSVMFTLIGILLYYWSLHRLRITCGRVEHSRQAAKVRRAEARAKAKEFGEAQQRTTAGVASLPSS